MQEFKLWLEIGLEHILSFNSWDHQLFLLCLALTFPIAKWKNTLAMLSFFTLAHSCSLILSTFNWVKINPSFTESAIALSILASAIYLLKRKENIKVQPILIYTGVIIFGLIHGLGFAHQLKSLLGREESLIRPLFYFNCGIEIAQIIFICLLLLFYLLLKPLLKNEETAKKLRIYLLRIIALVSAALLIQRLLIEV